jgi:hypothetical protein
MKKAEMSINMIVAAVIALLILIILAFLVTNKFSIFHKATQCGGTSNGVCAVDCATLEGGTYAAQGTGTEIGCKADESCCIKV